MNNNIKLKTFFLNKTILITLLLFLVFLLALNNILIKFNYFKKDMSKYYLTNT